MHVECLVSSAVIMQLLAVGDLLIFNRDGPMGAPHNYTLLLVTSIMKVNTTP